MSTRSRLSSLRTTSFVVALAASPFVLSRFAVAEQAVAPKTGAGVVTERASAAVVAPPSAPLSATAPASASASASSGPPPRPRLSAAMLAESLSGERTGAPRFSSWSKLPKLDTDAGAHPSCYVQLVREWLHVHCDRGDLIDITQLVGDGAGVALSVSGEELDKVGDAVLPLRRGHDVVLTFTAASFGRYSSGLPESVATLWVLWPASRARPTVRLE